MWCAQVCDYVNVCVCKDVCKWRSEINLEITTLLKDGLTGTWGPSINVDWLSSEPQGPSVSQSCSGVAALATYVQSFIRLVDIKLECLCLP